MLREARHTACTVGIAAAVAARRDADPDASGRSCRTCTGPDGQHRVFAYTADGERIVERDLTGGITTFTLRGLDGALLREIELKNGAYAWVKDYVYRDGQLLASQHRTEGHQHYHLDHLGTTRMVTNRCGERVKRYEQFPYGDTISAPANDTETRRFTGHQRDLGSTSNTNDDMDYMHARYYGMKMGRFLAVDPSAKSSILQRAQSWNRYSYVMLNPLKYIDPFGERWFQVYDPDKKANTWKYFPGVDYMEETIAGKKFKVLGLEQLVTYDGSKLTLFRPDGTTVSYRAWSGLGTSWDVTSRPEREGKRDEGPIPEGIWSFRPSDIETIGYWDAIVGLKGGKWRGSIKGWGFQRVELTPSDKTASHLRDLGRTLSGFYIHGGWSPGSRGCIDLVDNGERFFGWVDKSVPWVPVYVSYGGR